MEMAHLILVTRICATAWDRVSITVQKEFLKKPKNPQYHAKVGQENGEINVGM